jgi:hypothetical protein
MLSECSFLRWLYVFADQDTTVSMALPGSDGLEVNALLDCARDEAASERPRRKMGEIEAFASRIQSLFRVPHF